MTRFHSIFIHTASSAAFFPTLASCTALLLILASCGNETTREGAANGGTDTLATTGTTPAGEIRTTVTCEDCSDDDSIYVEVTDQELFASLAKEGCCCPGDTCMARMEIPMGRHRIRFLMPDSLRMASGGTAGGLDTVGYYSDTGLVQDPDSATEVVISEADSTAEVTIAID